jgi:hypothetical protein
VPEFRGGVKLPRNGATAVSQQVSERIKRRAGRTCHRSHGMRLVRAKPGNRVGFDRVGLSQTHARLTNGQGSGPTTLPMGLRWNPCQNPSGRPTRQGTHRVRKLQALIYNINNFTLKYFIELDASELFAVHSEIRAHRDQLPWC